MSTGVRCYVALGSNLADPLTQVETALGALRRDPGLRLVAHSSWYRSTPVGPAGQPDYINGVAAVDTTLDPLPLLHHLQEIEDRQGRVRGEHWGPRTLDLDLLLYGERVIESTELTVPHPRLAERNFVLIPLAEIEPDLMLPCGTALASLLAHCPRDGLQPLLPATDLQES